MKNIVALHNLQYCFSCKVKGFFGFTPDGADYHTCPSCGACDFIRWQVCQTKDDNKYARLYSDANDSDFDNDNRLNMDYCEKCKIMFDLGCTHHNGGCTDNTFNAHFIKHWRDKTTNEEHEGMPQFDDVDDWFNNANNIEVLEMFCPHKGNKCKKTYHEIKSTCQLI